MVKHITGIAALPLLLLAVACEHDDIHTPVDFGVTLDPSNTYLAGEPVRFNFSGNAEFLTVWNGDAGHEYRYKDRELAPEEALLKGELELRIHQQYGVKTMEVYLTDRFEGLKGRNTEGGDQNLYAQQDRAAIQRVIDSGFEGWEKFSFTDNTAATFQSYKADITRYVDNFTVAIRFRSSEKEGETTRSYMINPRITTHFDRYGTYTRRFQQLSFIPFRMQGLWVDHTPYVQSNEADFLSFLKVNQSGIVKLRGQKNALAGADIAFQGFKIGAGVHTSLPGVVYEPIDQWMIMQPIALNAISPDTGENIKGFADDVPSYTHTYTEPGSYTATFIASTGNYQGESRIIREVTFTIVEPIPAP